MTRTLHRFPAAVLRLVLLALALRGTQAAAQAVPDSVRVARLAGLGRLWGMVKYFHPALAPGAVDWDRALVQAVPKVRAASSAEEYAAALREMLAVLGDPATRVLGPEGGARLASPALIATRWLGDAAAGTYVIALPDPMDFTGAMAALNAAAPEVARAGRVIIDLRSRGRTSDEGAMAFVLANSALGGLLATKPVAAPGVRSRLYSGFPPQAGSTSGDYWAGTTEHPGDMLQPRPGNVTVRRVAFVVDESSDLPPLALGLQREGIAVIVAEGAAPEVAGRQNVWTATLPDSIRVAVRVAEYVNPDGSTGAAPDTVVPAVATAGLVPPGTPASDAALAAAVALLGAPARPRPAPAAPSPLVPVSERGYPEMRAPSLEYRLLAAFRYWNAIQYFYPYRSLMGEDWNRVLEEAIPMFEAASDSVTYALAVAHLATRIHDSHGFVASPALRGWLGAVPAPVKVRYIEGKPVITEISADSAVRATGIRVGDVVLRIDGATAEARRARLVPYLPASTPQALDATVANYLLNGAEGSMLALVVRGADNHEREVRLTRRGTLLQGMRWTRPGPTWRVLPGNVGYVDLEKLTIPQVDSMFEALRDTKAIVFDDRDYPQGTAWAIAPRLTERRQVGAARFSRVLAGSPDTTQWAAVQFVQLLPPASGVRYLKPTVLLVDERTISQAEHTGLFLEAANGTRIVGSPTMGANGDVTNVLLPGGIAAYFTGQAVTHADGRQLQRLGLQPDVVVRPTIAGVRAGRDEVLERALRLIQSGR